MDDNKTVKNTALSAIHEKMGAKMVEFAGYTMPVVYSSIVEEHKCVRSDVGIFDISHMGEFKVTGEKALDLIQKMTINDASNLNPGQAQYSAMCYPDGGIVDDLLVYKFDDYYILVVNASNLDKDFDWISKNIIEGAELTNVSDDITLIAVQGPKSQDLLQEMTKTDLTGIKYYWFEEGKVEGKPMIISRTGYTGEHGYELYMKNEYAENIWNTLVEKGSKYNLKAIGLGARDTLRLEKKMCLYGNDITKDTNPIEASLGWITKLDKGDFIGKEAITRIKEEGIKRRLIAFKISGRGVPRHGYEIAKDGKVIGEVTSGTFSPSLSIGIGMGYVEKENSRIDTEIDIIIRGKNVPAIIIKPPFI
ncbi:glycine cleavage system aminomethyltransferase GcvT [candidate division KSB1 bacterium]